MNKQACDIGGGLGVQVAPAPGAAPASAVLQEARPGLGARITAVGGGIVGAVCWGGGIAAVAATLVGSLSAFHFMRSWAHMQGLTLASDIFAIGLILVLAWWQTRSFQGFLAPAGYRRVYGRALYRLSVWALGGYIAYMVFGQLVLTWVGFQYLKWRGCSMAISLEQPRVAEGSQVQPAVTSGIIGGALATLCWSVGVTAVAASSIGLSTVFFALDKVSPVGSRPILVGVGLFLTLALTYFLTLPRRRYLPEPVARRFLGRSLRVSVFSAAVTYFVLMQIVMPLAFAIGNQSWMGAFFPH